MLQRRLLSVALLAVAASVPAFAQTWPTKPIRLVVPYPPGGNVDGAARMVSEDLAKALGQPVVVENKAGAGGLIAGEMVAKSPPDGTVFFVAANGPLLYSPTIFNRPLYHWQKDFVPVTTLTLTPLVLQSHPSVPARNARELVELARSKPEAVTMASPGAGTTNHLLSEMMQKVTGVKWSTVHYKGNAPATTDLLGGQVQFNFDQVSVAQGFVKEGRTRALGVAAPKRVPWLPDVPTLAEQGINGVEGQTFTGVLAPAGTPPAIINRMGEALRRILREPATVQKFYAAGSQAIGMTSDEFSAYLKQEEATWMPIIKAANIKAD